MPWIRNATETLTHIAHLHWIYGQFIVYLFFYCTFTRKSRISDMWQRTCMSWTWSCLHTDTCEDTPRDLIEHWGSGLLVPGDQWLSPNARARGWEFAIAGFKMHLFRAVYSPAAALRLYSPHICMLFHCATFTINPQGDYVWICAVTRLTASFLPTVVIEDDRIDDVLKGMTDKSSPGV